MQTKVLIPSAYTQTLRPSGVCPPPPLEEITLPRSSTCLARTGAKLFAKQSSFLSPQEACLGGAHVQSR